MRIYIIIDEYLNNDYHYDFVDAFTDPEQALNYALNYISENQSDGHKLKCIIKEL